jgi:hypothetical protein
LLVDTGGLVLGAHVHAASLEDRDDIPENEREAT